jgi:hypothetical protein
MSLILSGTDGLSDVDGSASTPAIRGTDTNTGIFFPAADTIAFAEGGAEVARFDSSGNLGIGVTADSSNKLQVNGDIGVSWAGDEFIGMKFGSGTSYKMGLMLNNTTRECKVWSQSVDSDDKVTFYTGSTPSERMRIDSSGNLLVGTTTSNRGRVFSVSSETAIPSVFALASNASFTNAVLSIYAARNTTNGSYELISAGCDFVATRFRVLDNGNVQNTNSSYGGISDIKLKENIVDASPKLEDLCKVKVRSYNFKTNAEDKQIGVVAQELEEVFPRMVEELIDRDKDGNDLGTKTKAVKYSVFVPMLIKAMQEQQAIITDLKSRIEALEAK